MDYVSEFTRFMNGWLDEHPQEGEVRRSGRALWWDRPLDAADRAALDAGRIPQKPYPYFQFD